MTNRCCIVYVFPGLNNSNLFVILIYDSIIGEEGTSLQAPTSGTFT